MTRDEMLDKREDVLDEFDDRVDPSHGVMTLAETRWFTAQLLADEIVRLREQLRDTHTKVFHLEEKLAWTERERDQLTSLPAERILAALREPSEAALKAACVAVVHFNGDLRDVIIAAVEAAEREVNHVGDANKMVRPEMSA